MIIVPLCYKETLGLPFPCINTCLAVKISRFEKFIDSSRLFEILLGEEGLRQSTQGHPLVELANNFFLANGLLFLLASLSIVLTTAYY